MQVLWKGDLELCSPYPPITMLDIEKHERIFVDDQLPVLVRCRCPSREAATRRSCAECIAPLRDKSGPPRCLRPLPLCRHSRQIQSCLSFSLPFSWLLSDLCHPTPPPSITITHTNTRWQPVLSEMLLCACPLTCARGRYQGTVIPSRWASKPECVQA